MVPEGWLASTLGDVAYFVNGRGFKPHEWSTTGLPIIRIQNLNGGGDFNYFCGDYNSKIEINTNDLLFAWSGSRGTSFGPHFWRGGKALLNYHTWKVVIDTSIADKIFMFEVLRHLTSEIEGEAHGAAALVHTQKNRIVDYHFVLPPLLEQKQLADILGTWSQAIEFLADQIAAKQRLKKGLMQQLLTGKVRVPEVNQKR